MNHETRLISTLKRAVMELQQENDRLARLAAGQRVVIEDIQSVACATVFGLALSNPSLDTSLVDMTDAEVKHSVDERYRSIPKPKGE